MTAQSPLSSLAARHFAMRGWLLAIPFLIVLTARALTPMAEAPLRPEWLIYVVAALALRLWAGAHLGAHGNGARAEAPRLARTGPYRFSRNPLYASNILAGAGLVLFANAFPLPVQMILIALVITHHIALVHHEESALRAAHGEAFALYAARTPRWYGLLRPRTLREDPDTAEFGGEKTSVATLLRRQGRNAVYMGLCVLLVWIAARA
jgi:protein-S-isoprenylcysteine O-methyltransferase Ste14